MNAEWFTAIALPVSVADDAPAHVTVFVAPTLRPDHDGPCSATSTCSATGRRSSATASRSCSSTRTGTSRPRSTLRRGCRPVAQGVR